MPLSQLLKSLQKLISVKPILKVNECICWYNNRNSRAAKVVPKSFLKIVRKVSRINFSKSMGTYEKINIKLHIIKSFIPPYFTNSAMPISFGIENVRPWNFLFFYKNQNNSTRKKKYIYSLSSLLSIWYNCVKWVNMFHWLKQHLISCQRTRSSSSFKDFHPSLVNFCFFAGVGFSLLLSAAFLVTTCSAAFLVVGSTEVSVSVFSLLCY